MAEMVGYRFHPNDEEIISHYLRNKILGNETLVRDAINEVNICKFDPWDLPQQSKIQSDDQVWYFFCPRDNKYLNSRRANRTTREGYWKATGRDRKVKAKSSPHAIIGFKKTLVFYKGRVPKGERTTWVMHEYHTSTVSANQKAYVICKVKNKAGGKPSATYCGGNKPCHPSPSDSEAVADNTSEDTLESGSNYAGLDDELSFQWSEQEEGMSIMDLFFPKQYSHDEIPLPPEFVTKEGDSDAVSGLELASQQNFVNSMLADCNPSGSVSGDAKNDTDADSQTFCLLRYEAPGSSDGPA